MAHNLEVGDKAPFFELPAADGRTVTLEDFKGQKLALYFFPKSDTPGCTVEALDFSKAKARFSKAGTAVLGVSADPAAAQQRFKKKHLLKIDLASDEGHKMLVAYGAWGKKSMYGRTFMGVIRRTVLIDAQGKIARVWPKVSVRGHAEEVLEAAKGL